ncbi:SCAN domain-containing protein 3 [Trichonephila clavipes]|nr:SCAN domain-containing protein 3 [Trichonephila clavipes]
MKFSFLRPLTSKRATELALELLKIFLEVSCPRILQSDNGREFTATVIQELKNMWPTCKIVYGRPRHPASKGSVERSNQDVEAMLRAWLIENNTKIGLLVVTLFSSKRIPLFIEPLNDQLTRLYLDQNQK